MDSEKKHSSLLENAVEKNDTRSIKNILTTERYDFKCLEGALNKAVEANNVDVVQLLLDHVESWLVTDALGVVFSAAAKAGRDEFMRFAVAIKLSDRSVPSAALYWAAGHGHSEWIKPLLGNGADVSSTDDGYGHTAIHAAAVNGHVDCLTALIEHGTDLNAGDDCRWTPLHIAARRGHTECVTALLQHDADINIKGFGDYTPLHEAAMYGHVDCFEKLVQSGADTTLRNNVNETALDIADWLANEKNKQPIQLVVKTFRLQKSFSCESDANIKPEHRKNKLSLLSCGFTIG